MQCRIMHHFVRPSCLCAKAPPFSATTGAGSKAIIIAVVGEDLTEGIVKAEVERELAKFDRYIEWQRQEIQPFNASLRDRIRSLIAIWRQQRDGPAAGLDVGRTNVKFARAANGNRFARWGLPVFLHFPRQCVLISMKRQEPIFYSTPGITDVRFTGRFQIGVPPGYGPTTNSTR